MPVPVPDTGRQSSHGSCSQVRIHPRKLKQVHKEPETPGGKWQVPRGKEEQSLCTRKVGVEVRSHLCPFGEKRGTHFVLGPLYNTTLLTLHSTWAVSPLPQAES